MSKRVSEEFFIKFAFTNTASQERNSAEITFNFLILQSCYCIENTRTGGCHKEPHRIDYLELISRDVFQNQK